MRAGKILGLVVLAALLVPVAAFARDIEPVVSTDWLQQNLGKAKLVIVDTRKVEDYKTEHVPGSVNVFYGAWAVKKGDLLNELPEADDLSDVIADAGIAADSSVVVVGPAGSDFAFITRVAWTLVYAGVPNVAVLDGGFAKWKADGKPVTADVPKVNASSFKVKPVAAYLIAKDAVVGKIGKVPMVDARAPDVSFGANKQAFVAQFGRVPGALSLPVAFALTPAGTLRPQADLDAMATSLFPNKNAETIVYCDSGVLCSGWWWIMHEMLGYKDVKSFDGSSQEISADSRVKFVRFKWN